MKKRCICFIILLLMFFGIPVNYAYADTTYTDYTAKVKFTLPSGWEQVDMSKPRQFIDAKFEHTTGNFAEIIYMGEDVWSDEAFREELGAFTHREDINNSMFTDKDISDMLGCDKSEISRVKFNELEYFCGKTEVVIDAYNNISIPAVYYVMCNNGYMYMFQYFGELNSSTYRDFVNIIYEAEYSDLADVNVGYYENNASYAVISVLLSLIITITVYTVPILIYRFAILKQPVAVKKAKKITLIYGIISFFIMFGLTLALNGSGSVGGAIILWSWVNYRILISGKNKVEPVGPSNIEIQETTKETIKETDSKQDVNDELDQCIYCSNCGAKLSVNSNFCKKCGAKVEK